MEHSKTCWCITDGHAGMVSQVQGLAEAVGIPTKYKVCKRRVPWVWFPALFPFLNPLEQLTPDSDTLVPPWPDLLITCGRRQLAYALWIRKKSKGKTLCVHVQNPRIPFHKLDLIIAPEHDRISGKNVVTTRGAIHKVTKAKLKEGAEEWAEYFSEYPPPYHVVLLGGSTNRFDMTVDVMKALIKQIKTIASHTTGSVLITPSFRTPHLELIHSELGKMDRIFIADLKMENPYIGMLGLADYIYVTNDSVNMMTEANITGKPLYLLIPEGHHGTAPSKFSDTLISTGVARIYAGQTQDWTYTPLNDTEKAAKKIRELLGL